VVLESFWVDRQITTVLQWCHLCNVSAPKWSDKMSGDDEWTSQGGWVNGVIAECGEWVPVCTVWCIFHFGGTEARAI
jgi:hypothetical protein